MKKRLIIFIFLIGIAVPSIAQNNKPTDVFQPSNPSIVPTYSFINYYGIGLNDSIFNYERTYVPRSSMAAITSSDYSKTYRTTTYYNGFGEVLEKIDRRGVSFDDIVTPYDLKRKFESYSFTPYPVPNLTSTHPVFQADPFNSQIAYHNTTGVNSIEGGFSFGKSQTFISNNTVYSDNYSTGLSFIGSGRAERTFVRYNNASIDGNITKWGINNLTGALTIEGNYNDNEIKVNVFEGQHNKVVWQYFDKDDKLIAKKVKNGSGWLETWYVYDHVSRIRWILPPNAISYSSGVTVLPNTNVQNDLCYYYEYNEYGQVVVRNVPDLDGAEYTVYDLKHRPIFTQTPLQRLSNEWSYVLYDGNGRAVVSGVFRDPEALSRQDMQSRAINTTWPSGITFQPLFTYIWNGLSGSVYPSSISNCDIDQYNYYDRYDNLPTIFSGIIPYYYLSSEYLSGSENLYPLAVPGMSRGLLVATKTRVKDPSNNNLWVHAINFYDRDARLVQTQMLNPWNTSNQWDIITNQYNFSGQLVLNIHQQYSWAGTDKQSTKLSTKYTYNVNNGTLLDVQQKTDNGDWRAVASYLYDKFGRVSQKLLGSCEQQNYKYSIRGQLTGINADYVYNNMASYLKTFGEIIGYDYGYTNNRYDGSIAGYTWRGSGALDCPRAYGYSYDDAGRMTRADFNQRLHPNGPMVPPGTITWKNTDVDYSVSDIGYDANGNMNGMKQMGMAWVSSVFQPVRIDSMTYDYQPNTNRLAKVTDPAAYHINDFLDGNTSGNDYTYDSNGNLTKDRNKGIDSIIYNNLDLPVTIRKGNDSISNIYDATGTLLQKKIVESGIITTYRYWGPFVYKDNKLDYYYHQEGRSRWLNDSSFFKDDFFVKDHFDNVRNLITADVSYGITQYNAGFEMAYANVEEGLFDNISGVRDMKPVGSPTDLMSGKLNGSADSTRIGAAILMHVMSGDQVNLTGYGYYESEDTTAYNTYSIPEDMANSLLTTISGGTNGLQTENANIPGLAPGTISGLLNPVNYNTYDVLKNAVTDPSYPRAYLNYLFFDEEMNLLPDECQITQLKSGPNAWSAFGSIGAKNIHKNGFVLVYFSNESAVDVYVDNEHIVNVKGRLLQEQHYYPHGLLIPPPVPASPSVATDHSYQSKKNQHELGMELHDFHARQYDAQIGRFWGVDPMDEFPSGYTGMGNDPANNVDPTGMMVDGILPTPPQDQQHESWNYTGPARTARTMSARWNYDGETFGGDLVDLANFITRYCATEGASTTGDLLTRTTSGIGGAGGGGGSNTGNGWSFWQSPLGSAIHQSSDWFNYNLNPLYLGVNGAQALFTGKDLLNGTDVHWADATAQLLTVVPVAEVANVAEVSILKVASKTKNAAKATTGGNIVYVSVVDGVTQYVGITNNLARRSAQHLTTKGINIEPLLQNLSRSDARAVEQVLIEIHGLGKNGGTLINKINSISPFTATYTAQLQRGYELLKSIGYK